MFEKSFITDCEGPLTLNDNAFEMAVHFIEDGGELLKSSVYMMIILLILSKKKTIRQAIL